MLGFLLFFALDLIKYPKNISNKYLNIFNLHYVFPLLSQYFLEPPFCCNYRHESIRAGHFFDSKTGIV